MHTVYVFFTGFRQSWEYPTGIEKIWREIRRLSSDKVWVLPPLSWNCDTEELAKLICRNTKAEADINIVGFSWGAGHAAMELAKILFTNGRYINEIIACDPVYRCKYLPHWFPDPLALFREIKITVPENVRCVHWMRQNIDFIQGHDLVATNPKVTTIDLPIIVKDKHALIDDSEEFKDLVRKNLCRRGFNLVASMIKENL
jgi:hypothetical protein